MIDIQKFKKVEDLKGKIREFLSVGEIIELANRGDCPHYVVTNPLSGEESIWFVASEVNSWFERAYVRVQSGYYDKEKFSFFYFDKAEFNANKSVPPNELSGIKELYTIPKNEFIAPPCIYFLCKEKKIQYIGQSVTLRSRIKQHIDDGWKDFDEVFFMLCPVARLTELEGLLIKRYKPPLNSVGLKGKYNEATPGDVYEHRVNELLNEIQYS